MATITDQITIKQSTTEAPLEPSLPLSTPFNLRLFGVIENEAGLSGSKSFVSLFQNQLVGCANVDLYEFRLLYKMTKADQTVKCGIFGDYADYTVDQVAGMSQGMNVTSNSMNYGVKHEVVLKVPEVFSKQIQPASALLPPCRLFLSATKGVQISYEADLKINGLRFIKNDLASF
jgi:hypothetical protein